MASVSALATLGGDASAAPALRKQVDVKGDFLLIGNTLGWDCGPGVPAPIVGTPPANCGAQDTLGDSGADALWRADEPPGGATASPAWTPDQARSTAVLTLPAGARVNYARIYWAAIRQGTTADVTATLDRPGVGGFSANLTADASFTVVDTATRHFYHSTVDVTDLVKAQGNGAYRLGGVDVLNLQDLNLPYAFASWALVVFYELDTDPQRNLALFDGLDRLSGANPTVTANLSGFLVPNTGFSGKLGLIAYEGDDQSAGDQLTFGSMLVWDALNPPNNFFNGTRSLLGQPVSVAGDLPRLTGGVRSYSGLDLDVIDVTKSLRPGQTSAPFTATSSGDIYLLGAFITSVSSLKPEFSLSSTKDVRDITRPAGPVRPGDEVEYTIVVKNTGNDTATNVVLKDALPVGLTYKPGTLQVTAGPNAGAKTDAVDTDQGEYDAATRTLRVRLGIGANALMGGTQAVGESTTVVFRATIDATSSGTILNQATITATGLLGNPATDYPTDGNGSGSGTPPTPLPIDECGTDLDCPVAKRYCLTSNDPNICVACRTGTDCPVMLPVCSASTHTCVPMCGSDIDCALPTPACLSSGFCGQCSATNKSACSGMTSACDLGTNKCVECIDNTTCPMGSTCNLTTKTCVGCLDNSMCSGTRPICDTGSKMCRACGSDAECPNPTTPACLASGPLQGSCGQCSATNKRLCVGATAACDVATAKCVECIDNTTCPMAKPLCDTATKVCAACLTDAMCMGTTPVCDATSRVCRKCGSDAECRNPMFPGCQPDGRCDECSATNNTRCMGTTKPVCNPAQGKCVECTSNTQCPMDKPVCNAATNTCRACANDGECTNPALPACLPGGACGECSASNKTRCTGGTPLCDVMAARCVACVSNTDCSGQTPYCHPNSRTCVPCESDGAPSCTDPLHPACQRTGPLAGACTECSATNMGACAFPKPVCLQSVGLCGCTDTDGDSECGGTMSGIVCSGPAGLCIPGCSTAQMRNGCPAAQMCSRTDGTVGMCNMVLGCQTGADCALPRPICDMGVNPRVCVQCLMDSQCPMGLVCGDTKTCVECTATKLQACTTSQAGPRCLASSTCGCTTDADCGNTTSGRVCDTTLQKCTLGCRGVGGNGCQAGRACTSTTNAIGTCIVIPDGGFPPDAAPDLAADRPIVLDVTADRANDAPTPGVDAVSGDRPLIEAGGDTLADAGLATDGGSRDGATNAGDAGDAGAAGDARRDGATAIVRGYVGGGGCSCTLPGGATNQSRGAGLAGLLIAGALVLARRRRR